MSSFLNSAGLMINNIQSSTWHMRYDCRVSKRLKHTCHCSDIQWSLLNANAAKSYYFTNAAVSKHLLEFLQSPHFILISDVDEDLSHCHQDWLWMNSCHLKKRFILNICNHWVFSFFPFLSHIIVRHHDMPNKHICSRCWWDKVLVSMCP